MAYMRNQHNMSYNNDFSSQSDYKPGGPSAFQHNQESGGGYSWESAGGHEASTSGQEGFGEYDYNYGYGEDFNQDTYNQDHNAGFEEGYGNEWRGGDSGNEGQWQGSGGGGRGPVGSGNFSNVDDSTWSGGLTSGGGEGNSYGGSNSYGGGNSYGAGSSYGGGNSYGGSNSYGGGNSYGAGSSYGPGFTMSSSVGEARNNGNTGFVTNNRGAGRFDAIGRGNSAFARGGGTGANSGFSRGRGMGSSKSSITSTLNTNVGLPLIDQSAVKSQKPVESEVISPSAAPEVFIKKWQTFARDFADCGNSISNMECSLKASKVNHLQLSFDCKFLTKCSNYNIFSGVLHVKKLVNNDPTDTFFMARGHGMSKKSAKLDCYEKAYKLLLGSSVEDIISQTDSGETVLRQEIHHQYRQNPKGFMDTLKRDNVFDEEPEQPSRSRDRGFRRGSSGKRSNNSRSGGSDQKRPRLSPFFSDLVDNKNLSLAPTRKIDVLMHPGDPLIDKLEMLRQLLREEGITRLHIVPKIDQLAHKVAIHIQNVYRFEDVPAYGYDEKLRAYCEIYFDDVFMARGLARAKRINAMQHAYSNLGTRLSTQSLELLANNPRVWHPYNALDMDICSIVTKWQGKDNDSLLTSNLTNMKQMMQSMPDVTIPLDKMVLTEHESDKDIENVFKSLELSATRNLMLLECETIRNPDLTFTCTLSLQGRVLASRLHPTKNGAKRLCSEAVMTRLKTTQDVIYVKMEMVGKTITKSELLLAAAKKKALGEPPAKIFKKITDYRDDSFMLNQENRYKQGLDREKFQERENLPENISARPLLPWIAASMYEILDDYYQKISLEDLMLDVGDMPKSQRDTVSSCAAKMGLRMVTKNKNSFDGPILRRTVTAQDMSKILQLHGGESGRYKLISCKNPLSEEELDEFRSQCLEQHKRLVEARINDDPDADAEHLVDEAAEEPPPTSVIPGDRDSSSKSWWTHSRYAPSELPTEPIRSSYVQQPMYGDEDSYNSRGPMYPGMRRSGGPPRPLMEPSLGPMVQYPPIVRRPYSRY